MRRDLILLDTAIGGVVRGLVFSYPKDAAQKRQWQNSRVDSSPLDFPTLWLWNCFLAWQSLIEEIEEVWTLQGDGISPSFRGHPFSAQKHYGSPARAPRQVWVLIELTPHNSCFLRFAWPLPTVDLRRSAGESPAKRPVLCGGATGRRSSCPNTC